ncbi:MAG TPA: hypothetical protein VFN37_06435 [Candidatus Baltobacteraceae bacterium]|nr:hypothetical protein [Candidatus Baltobacteraceae bacterium]
MLIIGAAAGVFGIVPAGAAVGLVQFAVVELAAVFGLVVTLGAVLLTPPGVAPLGLFVLVLVPVAVVLVVVVALVAAVPGGHGVVVVVDEFVVVVLGVVVVGCVVVVCAKAGRAILTTSPPMDARPRIARKLMRLILLGKQKRKA